MVLTPDDHRRIRFDARSTIAQHLVAHAFGKTAEVSESYACGILDGVRDFLVAHFSERIANEALQAATDAALSAARPQQGLQ